MMKILIVDDEPLARERLRALVNELGMGEVVAEAGNGREALIMAPIYQPQVILLDIRMPAIDGIQVIQQLISQHPTPAVIFTTAYSGHALEAFEYQAVDYLLKPIRKERLERALERAYTFIQSQLTAPPMPTPAARTHIRYYQRGEFLMVPVKQIYYFSADQKFVFVRWAKGNILISETIKDLEQEFAGQFLRIHRRTLVSMVQIASLYKDNNGQYYIRLRDIPEQLEVSRRHLKTVKELLKDMRIPSSA